MLLVFRFGTSPFKPKIGKRIDHPRERSCGEVPAFTLAMTNDPAGRRHGRCPPRRTPSSPTSEPLTGTNIIGKVLDAEKLEQMREGTTVYVREVK